MRRKYATRKRYGRRRAAPVRRKAKPAAMARRKRATGSRRAPAAGLRLTRPMRALVDRRVDKKLETRVIKFSAFPVTHGGGSNSYSFQNAITTLSIGQLIPKIESVPSGSTTSFVVPNQPYRVGAKINVRWLTVRVRVYTDYGVDSILGQVSGADSLDRSQIEPYILLFKDKERRMDPADSTGIAAALAELWYAPCSANTPAYPVGADPPVHTAVSGPFTGERDNFKHGWLNSKRFTKIAARSCFLTRDIGRYTDFGAEGGGYAGRFAPTKTFTFRVPLPKQLKYANPADNYPSNTSMPWIAIGFSYTNGAAASAQAPLRAETSVSFAFTDTM